MKYLATTAALAAACILSPAFAQLKPPSATQAAPTGAGTPSSQATGENTDKENAGKLAAQGWLVLLDRKDWGRAWETTAAVFRSKVPLATWMDGIPKVRGSLGDFVERVPVEAAYRTALEGQPPGEYVTVIFASKFKDRELQEVVTTVHESDGRWRVTGYSTR